MAKIVQTAGRNQLGEFAPMFAGFNDDILFGEVWSDETLDLKTRSIITVSAFMGRGLVTDAFKHHLQNAKKNGVSKAEIAALITHAAFYIGWPMGWAAFNLAKEIWNDETPAQTELEKYAQSIFFPIGEPNDAYAQYFIGKSYLATVSNDQIPIHNVTFEPRCRNNWHIHKATSGGGQLLIGVGGRGWYQEWEKDPVEINPGTVINIPANVKHWHGASKDGYFSHLAMHVPGENQSNEWLEPVTDEVYDRLK